MTCPRCIGGQMMPDVYGDRTCLQCGYVQYGPPPAPPAPVPDWMKGTYDLPRKPRKDKPRVRNRPASHRGMVLE